ncbi:MAG: transporter [Bacteroidaceae bacterium]|nr:transporter [Bacteroidaceae bacterium]MBP9637258.1 transporter [Bacteroidaceae bacterium]
MLKFFKNWTLPIAMTVGAMGYPFFIKLQFLTPYLIFTMLLLTFCKVAPRDLKLDKLHFWLLLIQLLGAIGIFLLIAPFNKVVAEGAMVCIICPTATAAAVITQKLGGSAAHLTSYTLLGNLGTAMLVPILFPLIEPHNGLTFWQAFITILSKVFPLLICPFLLAWALKEWAPRIHDKLLHLNGAAFYIWSVALAIVTGITLNSLIHDTDNALTQVLLAVAALATCVLQFALGKKIGTVYDNRISGGQALGQKNTLLAIWMAQTYLVPVTSLAPGTYVIWQNVINSFQLWKKRKKDSSALQESTNR